MERRASGEKQKHQVKVCQCFRTDFALLSSAFNCFAPGFSTRTRLTNWEEKGERSTNKHVGILAPTPSSFSFFFSYCIRY